MMQNMTVWKTIGGLASAIVLFSSCGGGEQTSPGAATDISRPTDGGATATGARADESQPPKPPPKADLAPDFTVTTFEGERFRLSEVRGIPVVLNFWESW